MMRWSETVGREVVDTSTAEGVGRVEGLVLDVDSGDVAAIVVGGRIVSWADAEGIGSDAVTLRSADLLSQPDTDAARSAVAGRSAPISKRVITEDGFELGTVVDIEFDPYSGAVDRLVLDDGEVGGRRLLGVGSFAVVVGSGSGVGSDGGTEPRRRQGAPGGQLQDMTKADLYDLATEREVVGRSRMNKSELIDALSDTESRP